MRRSLATWVGLAFTPALLLAEPSVADLLQQAEIRINAEQFAAAEPLLLNALKLEPANAEVLYRLGYVRFRERKLSTARNDFAAVVKLSPPAYYSRYFLGRIALLENKPREAVDWLEPVVTARQTVFDAVSQLAAAYASAGMAHKAIPTLRTAIAETPWDAALYYRLGRLYTQAGQKELAAEALENSRRLTSANREDVEILMNVAQLLNGGKPTNALESGSRILNRREADPNALVALGVIYGNANLPAEALNAFELAAERDSGFFQAQYNRGLALLKLNRAAEALQPLTRAVALLPQSVEANQALGLAAVLNQRYQDAVTPLERIWKADSSNVRIGALLATAYLRTGAARKAAAVLESPAMRSSPDPAALLLLVEARNAAEDPGAALQAAEEARKRFPQLPQAHMAVAQQLARLGRYREARPAFEDTLKFAPGHVEAELGLADTLARSGDHAAAIDHYRIALPGEGTAVAACAGLARSLVALRRLDEAQQVLESGISRHSSEIPLHVELSRVYARLGKSELAAEQTKIIESLRGSASKP